MAKEVETVAYEPKKLTKADARKAIFENANEGVSSVPLMFNGVALELRRPTVQQFMNTQQDEDSGKAFMVKMLIEYAYIAGTDERPFEISDYDSLLEMPFNKSWAEVTQAVQKIIDIKVEDKVKN